MPVTLTYPGVYIQEAPSGVRTITGVATSITAFLGRALRGPVNEAQTINSFADFERIFGGLWVWSTLGFAVRDFFLNQGAQAVVVRLYHDSATDAAEAVAAAAKASTSTNPADVAKAAADKAKTYTNDPAKTAATTVATAATAAAGQAGATPDTVRRAARVAADSVAPAGKAQLTVGDFTFEAASAGTWGNNLRVSIDLSVSAEAAAQLGLTTQDLFNLTVIDTSPGGRVEKFLSLTVKNNARRIDRVLKAQSTLLRWSGTWPGPNKLPKIAAGSDAVSTAAANLANKQADLKAAQSKLAADQRAGQDVTADQQAVTAAHTAVTTAQQALDTAQTALGGDDGLALTQGDFTGGTAQTDKTGLYALEQVDLFNLLCIPPYLGTGDIDVSLVSEAAAYCEKRRAMLLVDPPSDWIDKDTAKKQFTDPTTDYVGTRSSNAALFFPRLQLPNPLKNNQVEEFVPCGAVAGIFARTDATRGIWKAPAGLDATLTAVPQLAVNLTDPENGELNPLGVNCLRTFPLPGRVVWGSRTLRGADGLADQYKYIPVRRLALYIEESLYRSTQWVVFEPNDEPLWAQIRLNVGAFMHDLFRKGAFQGTSPSKAYFVKCDKETTTQNDINLGIVNIVVGFAPLKPAEFVVITIQQIAGDIQV
jgi:phage tail sheath protein FI